MRDNGNLADDAYRILLDNIVLGETAIGASNTFAASNLRKGSHNLTLIAIIAPDNVATYEINLSDGLTFSDGSTRRATDPSPGANAPLLPQGGSITFSIVVPSQ